MSVEQELKVMWAMKRLKLDWTEAIEQRLNRLTELDGFRRKDYECSVKYKEKKKMYHGLRIAKREFADGDLVLLFNSRICLFSGKLKSMWIGHS